MAKMRDFGDFLLGSALIGVAAVIVYAIVDSWLNDPKISVGLALVAGLIVYDNLPT